MQHGITRRSLIASAGALCGFDAVASSAGVTDSDIRIGASMVLSGPLGPQTQDYVAGSKQCFDAVNAAGGVHGRKISYTVLDDAFDVNRAVANTRRLIEQDKVFLIYNNTGTAHTAAILPLVKESKTIIFGPVTGATALRKDYNRYLFHVRASYADEAQKILGQAAVVGLERVVVFYQDDPFGKALLAEVQAAAVQAKVKILDIAAVNPKSPDFGAAAAKLAESNPQAIIMGTAGGTFGGFLKAMHALGRLPVYYGFSVVSVDQTSHELGPLARGIVLAQTMPSLNNRSNPAVLDYLKLVGDGDAPSMTRFEGYVHARVLVEGLRRTGRDLSTDNLIRALESAGEISFGKFASHYSTQSHNGSNYVELAIVDERGRLRY